MPIAQLKLNETGKSKTNNALSFSPGTRECLYEESCVKILKKEILSNHPSRLVVFHFTSSEQ